MRGEAELTLKLPTQRRTRVDVDLTLTLPLQRVTRIEADLSQIYLAPVLYEEGIEAQTLLFYAIQRHISSKRPFT
jgi:hypothetical protein